MTKFPSRETKLDNPFNDPIMQRMLDELQGICDCGHVDYKHEVLPQELRVDKYEIEYGQCKDCMCPRFNLQHKATWRTVLFGHKESPTKC